MSKIKIMLYRSNSNDDSNSINSIIDIDLQISLSYQLIPQQSRDNKLSNPLVYTPARAPVKLKKTEQIPKQDDAQLT